MFENVFGFSFYALDEKQVSEKLIKQFKKAEAILFSNEDLKEEKWNLAWINIEKIAKMIGSENVSFHFPMDECDYVNNEFVKMRLLDSIERANKLGINKIVVHPNLRYMIDEWKNIDRLDLQRKLYQTILELTKKNNYSTILCVENMPPIGNKFDDADSAILFIDDFIEGINYTFDICHYYNVVKTMEQTKNKKEWTNVLAEIKNCDYYDFINKMNSIKHYHFSAFNNIANPFIREECIEGILPNQSIVDEEKYAKAMKIIYNDCVENNKSIIFEISEKDYSNRENIFKMLEWAKKIVEK